MQSRKSKGYVIQYSTISHHGFIACGILLLLSYMQTIGMYWILCNKSLIKTIKCFFLFINMNAGNYLLGLPSYFKAVMSFDCSVVQDQLTSIEKDSDGDGSCWIHPQRRKEPDGTS